jgi:hypothetical protein
MFRLLNQFKVPRQRMASVCSNISLQQPKASMSCREAQYPKASVTDAERDILLCPWVSRPDLFGRLSALVVVYVLYGLSAVNAAGALRSEGEPPVTHSQSSFTGAGNAPSSLGRHVGGPRRALATE